MLSVSDVFRYGWEIQLLKVLLNAAAFYDLVFTLRHFEDATQHQPPQQPPWEGSRGCRGRPPKAAFPQDFPPPESPEAAGWRTTGAGGPISSAVGLFPLRPWVWSSQRGVTREEEHHHRQKKKCNS